jgi:diguanylate cyclase (GGDEF)-like protein
VTFLGEGLGVLHVVSGVHEAADADSAETLGRIAAEAGNRIGTLRASQRTQLQATTDGLTGLLNRRSAEDRVRELQSLGVPLAVALCDLDHFKSINDTFGHETGDRALRLFSATLRSVMRSEDVVARYGGEEFLLVMPGCHADTAHEVLGRIRTELELTLHGGGAPNFTASFGLAMAGPERPFEEAVRAADRALMTAKDEGRDRIVMDSAAVRP